MTTHVISYGDTPWNLAIRYTGNGNRWPELCNANPALPKHPQYGCVFTVGREIQLPVSWAPALPGTTPQTLPGAQVTLTTPSGGQATLRVDPTTGAATSSSLPANYSAVPAAAPAPAPSSALSTLRSKIPATLFGVKTSTVLIGAALAVAAGAVAFWPKKKMTANRSRKLKWESVDPGFGSAVHSAGFGRGGFSIHRTGGRYYLNWFKGGKSNFEPPLGDFEHLNAAKAAAQKFVDGGLQRNGRRRGRKMTANARRSPLKWEGDLSEETFGHYYMLWRPSGKAFYGDSRAGREWPKGYYKLTYNKVSDGSGRLVGYFLNRTAAKKGALRHRKRIELKKLGSLRKTRARLQAAKKGRAR